MREWLARHRLAVVVVATVQALLSFGIVGWLAWHGQLRITPVVGALVTPLAAIQARYLLAALTAAVGEWVRNRRIDSTAWLDATIKQIWQVPLTTGIGYLLGAAFLTAYLLTWHGGAAEQRAVLYTFQAGIGGVGTNVVIALATAPRGGLPRLPGKISTARRRRWMVGLAAMAVATLVPILLMGWLFVGVGTLGSQSGGINLILGVMIVGIAGLTAAVTNLFSYRQQTGSFPVSQWLRPWQWDQDEWLRMGYLASLFWSRELIPGIIRTAAFFLGFPAQDLYLRTAARPVQQVAQLVLTASQQASASVLNLVAVAVRNLSRKKTTAAKQES